MQYKFLASKNMGFKDGEWVCLDLTEEQQALKDIQDREDAEEAAYNASWED